MGGAEDVTSLWDELADELCAASSVTRSTMMGLPCLRVDGAFFASLARDEPRLLVKLPADRVAAMVEAGHGHPFAPAGRTFREWVAVDGTDEDTWRGLLAEARAFVENAA